MPAIVGGAWNEIKPRRTVTKECQPMNESIDNNLRRAIKEMIQDLRWAKTTSDVQKAIDRGENALVRNAVNFESLGDIWIRLENDQLERLTPERIRPDGTIDRSVKPSA